MSLIAAGRGATFRWINGAAFAPGDSQRIIDGVIDDLREVLYRAHISYALSGGKAYRTRLLKLEKYMQTHKKETQ